jgi:16S rRNA (cytidine1402-2'-O)-methyltransferase
MNSGLYLVSTPIGNLDDITIRAINVLKNSDLILCENTTNSKKLLKKYDIKTSLSKYTDHDFQKRKKYIIDLLNSNKVISLISDSGSPLISDPGNQLINFLFKNHFRVYSIPGASALISGIQLSGFLNKKKFTFVGFLPKKKEQKEKVLLANNISNLIIYSTKQQLQKDVNSIASISKSFEVGIKGELVLAVNVHKEINKISENDKKEILAIIVEVGSKKAYQLVKSRYKISRNDFYKLSIDLRNV